MGGCGCVGGKGITINMVCLFVRCFCSCGISLLLRKYAWVEYEYGALEWVGWMDGGGGRGAMWFVVKPPKPTNTPHRPKDLLD